MNIATRLRQNKPLLSFEVFPPKTNAGQDALFYELSVMAEYQPDYISVTYGAGGSTRDKTLEIAVKIKNNLMIEPLVHFTCVGQSKDSIAHYLNEVRQLGFNNILALRGDPSLGESRFTPHPQGFAHANELVSYIRTLNHFTIGVAGYPEGHIEAPDLDTDITNLKKKVDAGADFIITQLFFNNEKFYVFMDKLLKAGITIPVLPGIMPLINSAQIQKVTALCNPDIPDSLLTALENNTFADDAFNIGVEYTLQQCTDLLAFGVPGFHFYPLNKSSAIKQLLDEFWLSNTNIHKGGTL